MSPGRFRLLRAAEAARQLLPRYVSLNYQDMFKIQQVRNPFPLQPVSFSRLASYLECPGCALDVMQKRRPKEPVHFNSLHQETLFHTGFGPDPLLSGTLLHTTINFLHDPQGPLSDEHRDRLRYSPEALKLFLRQDLLPLLQGEKKLKLAMFLNDLSTDDDTLRKILIIPMLRYQREMALSKSVVFAPAERFQFKLISTGETFQKHRDWGGVVGIVGEFDQIRWRLVPGPDEKLERRPAIMEFKHGFGKKKYWDREGDTELSSDFLEQPGMLHAMQLMTYWLAFQTRWDVLDQVVNARGMIEDIPMPLLQELDLIIYNLKDGKQYQLCPTDHIQAIQALTNCIFCLHWAMKHGYVGQAAKHTCRKTKLVEQVPLRAVQVGNDILTAEDCYLLAREAFNTFRETVRWKMLPLYDLTSNRQRPANGRSDASMQANAAVTGAKYSG